MFKKVDRSNLIPMTYELKIGPIRGVKPMPARMEVEVVNKLLNNLPYVEYSIVSVEIPSFQ